ncbi:ribosomal-processing cysteine protease Prp [Brevibacillus sp. SYSU BS000544]|uniref:ribosomal-processing cysteine protease Prp n=1 Tax=Brevibacillus sp. SYSU BS000544 TaxID=3416443 RepID=UPI003CE59B85
MIKVSVTRSKQGVEEITISGHARAAEHGKDIVCAAVSGISLGLLNSVVHLLGFKPDVSQAGKEGGFLRWSLHQLDDQSLHEKQQLLAESMIISLVAIEQQYGKFITVRDSKLQGGAE